MSFHHAQAVYKKNMQQTEQFKKYQGEKQKSGFSSVSATTTVSSTPQQTTSQQEGKSNGVNAYREKALQTASRGDLTLLLYNGCIKFVDKAKQAMESDDMEAKNKYIIRAQDIIRELMVTLKTDTEIGQNMFRLYDFIHHRLVESNINNDVKALEEARSFIVEFRDTWKEMMKIERKERFGDGGKA